MGILQKLAITGRVEACLVSPERNRGPEKARLERLHLSYDGIEGDCHAARIRESDSRMLQQYRRGTPVANSRQVSLVSAEELADIAVALDVPSLMPEWLGANVMTSGIPNLTFLPPSSRMMFASGATLIVDLENAPCRYPAEVIERHHPGHGLLFPKLARHKRGLVARVEHIGEISIGDEIVLFIPRQRIYAH
jgi:MOSC domain-containing protein YiiM